MNRLRRFLQWLNGDAARCEDWRALRDEAQEALRAANVARAALEADIDATKARNVLLGLAWALWRPWATDEQRLRFADEWHAEVNALWGVTPDLQPLPPMPPSPTPTCPVCGLTKDRHSEPRRAAGHHQEDAVMHECPAPGCAKQITRSQLCCPRHWFSLPLELRRRVLAEYRREPLGPAHLEVIAEAVGLLNA